MLDREGFAGTGLAEVGQVQRRTLLALPAGTEPAQIELLAEDKGAEKSRMMAIPGIAADSTA